jgi:hypothetical protein
MDSKEITRQLGAEWNALSDPERKPYALQAQTDKERFQVETQEYDDQKQLAAE